MRNSLLNLIFNFFRRLVRNGAEKAVRRTEGSSSASGLSAAALPAPAHGNIIGLGGLGG